MPDLIHLRHIDVLSEVSACLETTGHYSDQELRCLVWFHTTAYDGLLNLGWERVGWVFRQRDPDMLLVVKATREDTQYVVFISARTPMDCVSVFARQYFSGTLKWVLDKFA